MKAKQQGKRKKYNRIEMNDLGEYESPVTNKPVNNKSKKKNFKKYKIKKFKWVGIIAIILGFIVAYMGVKALNYNRLNNKAEKYMENQMYDEAEAVYEKIDVSYKKANVKNKLDLINKLRESNVDYAEGIREYHNGNDSTAIEYLVKVIKEDKKNYEDARRILKELDPSRFATASEKAKDKKNSKEAKTDDGKSDPKKEKLTYWDYSSASSTLNENGYIHTSKLALDGNMSTNWCEGAKDSGVGEWIKLESSQEKTLSKLIIYGGNYKSEYWYQLNNRLKRVRIEFSDGKTEDFDLMESFPNGSVIEFENPVKTRSIKIIIQDVYKGNSYDDTPISMIKTYSPIENPTEGQNSNTKSEFEDVEDVN